MNPVAFPCPTCGRALMPTLSGNLRCPLLSACGYAFPLEEIGRARREVSYRRFVRRRRIEIHVRLTEALARVSAA